jgi:tRNA (cmo5U34)-methyltransferase
MTEDRIYSDDKLGDQPFRFDATVAEVFPDMLRRSIPGYAASLEAIGSLAARYVGAGTNCYDLGCSLGAATLAMRQGIRAAGCRIVSIDNAGGMIERCAAILARDDSTTPGRTPVDLVLGDIRDADIANASMVVMNYTLQFLPVEDREPMLRRIFDGLVPGGLLLLSEKVVDEDPHMESLLVDLHHEHKRRNDYSQLEISRKRAALENVLIPETVAMHRQRLSSAGFAHSAVWLRYFNFVSIVAIKGT